MLLVQIFLECGGFAGITAFCFGGVLWKQDGLVLQYVKEQTPEICLAAIEQDEWALKYVKEQTPEICLAAVKQNGLDLEHVREQTLEICLAAVKRTRQLCYVYFRVLKKPYHRL